MREILIGIVVLGLAYIFITEGVIIFRTYMAKRCMIRFFKKFKDSFQFSIRNRIISHHEFDSLKQKVISIAIDEMTMQEVSKCKIFFDMETDRDKDLKYYNEFLLKSKILEKPVRFEKNPLERIYNND